jgi:hypothetical protein
MNYRDTKTGEIKKELVAVMMLLGFNVQSLTDNDFNLIATEVQKNYGYMDFGAIKKAFTLAMNGHLDEEIRTDKRFSYFYVSKYLLSMKRYNLRRKSTREPLNVSRQIEQKKLTKEENAENWLKWSKEETKKNGKAPLLADWDAIFWILTETDEITLDDEEKEIFSEVVRAELENELARLKQQRKDIKTVNNKLNNKKAFKMECRKRIVIKYLENGNNK